MKAKVLTYSGCGTKVIQKYMNLTPVNGSKIVFIGEPDAWGKVGLIFKFNEVFYHEADYPKQVILNNADKLSDLHANYLGKLPSGNWISILHIELFKMLGIDTSVLESRRAAIFAERNEQERQKQQEKVERYKQEQEKHKAVLMASLEKLKSGERIERDHFLELCKLNGIELHSRTIGMLNKLSVCEIGTQNAFIPKGRINLDKVFEAAQRLAAN